MRLYLSPDIFIFYKNQQFICWNFKKYQQHILSHQELQQIILWSNISKETSENLISNNANDNRLVELGILLTQEPASANWQLDDIAWIFHQATQDMPKTEQPRSPDSIDQLLIQAFSQKPPYPFTQRALTNDQLLFRLPKADLNLFAEKNFFQIIKERKTARQFIAKDISLNLLSTLLFSCFGHIHGAMHELAELGLFTYNARKSYPSAATLHPLIPYIYIANVNGLTPGIYRYTDQEHALIPIKTGHFHEQLNYLMLDQYFIENIAMGIFFVIDFTKISWKFTHAVAYREALLEIGHASQTFLLAATALNLATWLSGALRGSATAEFLGIDNINASALHFAAVGYSDGQQIPDTMLKKIKAT